jgi:hypothetical protein
MYSPYACHDKGSLGGNVISRWEKKEGNRLNKKNHNNTMI